MWTWPSYQVSTLSLAAASGKSAFYFPTGSLAAGAKLVMHVSLSWPQFKDSNKGSFWDGGSHTGHPPCGSGALGKLVTVPNTCYLCSSQPAMKIGAQEAQSVSSEFEAPAFLSIAPVYRSNQKLGYLALPSIDSASVTFALKFFYL